MTISVDGVYISKTSEIVNSDLAKSGSTKQLMMRSKIK